MCVGTGGALLFRQQMESGGGGGEQVRLPPAPVAAAAPVLAGDPSPWPVGAEEGGRLPVGGTAGVAGIGSISPLEDGPA